MSSIEEKAAAAAADSAKALVRRIYSSADAIRCDLPTGQVVVETATGEIPLSATLAECRKRRGSLAWVMAALVDLTPATGDEVRVTLH